MKLLFVGDTHRNAYEAQRINALALYEKPDLIIQVGDFAYDYDNRDPKFLETCAAGDVPWWFIRGNHDSTDWLRTQTGLDTTVAAPDQEPIDIWDNVWWLPDGTRAELDGVKFLFVGGAYSIDRWCRTEGVSYWVDELTPDPDLLPNLSLPTDVLVSHDVPAGLGSDFEKGLAEGRYKEDAESQANRDRMRVIYDRCQPKVVIHGHYHTDYREGCLIGLSCDNMLGNTFSMDTTKLEFTE